jgi:hypothetical protein
LPIAARTSGSPSPTSTPERINAWNSHHLPIYEPGLDAVIARTGHESLYAIGFNVFPIGKKPLKRV